jgi:hypothetical protein
MKSIPQVWRSNGTFILLIPPKTFGVRALKIGHLTASALNTDDMMSYSASLFSVRVPDRHTKFESATNFYASRDNFFCGPGSELLILVNHTAALELRIPNVQDQQFHVEQAKWWLWP